jgi:ABC-type uncharacterized transport system permease subunit
MSRNLLAGLVQLLVTVAVVVAVLLVVIVPFALSQQDPQAVLKSFLLGPLDSLRHIGNIAEVATPIALTGLAAAIIFRSGLFNLGMEGGFFLGGLGATAAALLLPLPPFGAPLMAIVVGAVVGSFACIAPGYLRVRHDASEMVTSLVLNFAILFAGVFVLNYFLRDPAAGTLMSYRIPAEARLERLLPGTRLNSGAIVAVAACVAGGVWLFMTRSGLNLRIAGSSPGFAAHLGLPSTRIVMTAQAVGGLIAGMAGAIEVLGLYPRFSWTQLPGLGWSGIIVAILARENPLLVLPAALFLGYLQVGGNILAQDVGLPSEVVGLVTAVIMLAVTASAIFQNPRLLALIRKLRRPEAQAA